LRRIRGTEEGAVSRVGRRSEEESEDSEDVGALEGGCLGERGEDGDVVRAGGAAGAKADFAEDDERPQGAFGMVVGGRSVVYDEGKELLVFRRVGQKPLAKGFGFGKAERGFAMGAEFGAQAHYWGESRTCSETDNRRNGTMTTLEMTSWKEGLQTVSLIEVVKQYSTGSLIRAKAEVECLLLGEAVKLEFETESQKEAFRQKAETLGVICS
jgi:hypothetical protein